MFVCPLKAVHVHNVCPLFTHQGHHPPQGRDHPHVDRVHPGVREAEAPVSGERGGGARLLSVSVVIGLAPPHDSAAADI